MSAPTEQPFLTPQQHEVLAVIEAAVHASCGDQNCGADDIHTEDAVEVLHALEGRGWLDLDAVVVSGT